MRYPGHVVFENTRGNHFGISSLSSSSSLKSSSLLSSSEQPSPSICIDEEGASISPGPYFLDALLQLIAKYVKLGLTLLRSYKLPCRVPLLFANALKHSSQFAVLAIGCQINLVSQQLPGDFTVGRQVSRFLTLYGYTSRNVNKQYVIFRLVYLLPSWS